jgi:hypothetical protein
MGIKDSFNDLKNTLKMELGKIAIDNITTKIEYPKLKELKQESKAQIRALRYEMNVNILKSEFGGPKVKKLTSDNLKITVDPLDVSFGIDKISGVSLPKKDQKIKNKEVVLDCEFCKFKNFLYKSVVLKESIFLKREKTISANVELKNPKILNISSINIPNIMKATNISKKVKIRRLWKPQKFPMIKRPVKRDSINFIYVFEGKKYLENLGYKYSNLVFLNYFDMIPMDLVQKILIEKDFLKIFYKRGKPKKFIDVATFEDKVSKNLLLAPVKEIKN